MKRIFSMLCMALFTLVFARAANAQSTIEGAWQMKNAPSGASITPGYCRRLLYADRLQQRR
ncbi:hypothetical protein MKQ70_36925 [Chitinophaga sedimenti]|uniref:hypothetical protein n=1 Tax=Chitinophaga sedimenti TaxID=2033606 RepID=UPI002002A736|nr:hypothetical protein [Chitinophaga sedimenti]MCK7560196.1 hypothetical protein [Chitinophaga sedimenti]